MGKKTKKKHPGYIADNRKARFDYEVEESVECGIVLQGTEVKSLREGKVSFVDSFCDIKKGELWLRNIHIAPYDFGSHNNHDPLRPRKLLAHHKEIARFQRRIKEKGYTLIPLKLYFKQSLVKVEVGVCRGKKLYDKRETIKRRDIDRDHAREIKQVS